MHNNIMASGSRDRLPMLATGRYAQWQSRFLRYIDNKPKGCLEESHFREDIDKFLQSRVESNGQEGKVNDSVERAYAGIMMDDVSDATSSAIYDMNVTIRVCLQKLMRSILDGREKNAVVVFWLCLNISVDLRRPLMSVRSALYARLSDVLVQRYS
ncbi:hypothetical protein Tco_1043574 [Tanacetum coccineum]|uniref:Uncharacterized protein n=1 Tax=Tanacetum coccineum TaxID=301880 RepID=A0ABQ5GNQ6_9ASTR